MNSVHLIIFIFFIGWIIFQRPIKKRLWKKISQRKNAKQIEFISNYRFSDAICQRVKKVYPHLNDTELARVMVGLREYFIICVMANRRMVAMPSQVVDVAWHEFILFTRDYQQFCRHGFGRFLHHTPTEAMKKPTKAQDGIKRAWRLSCEREQINPKAPTALPILFTLDGELKIIDGFHYSLNCKNSAGNAYHYCAGHIGCGGGCGGDFSGGCGGDSGSDGGSSCGGGCGGGGD